ncbi:ATP-binding protein [Streptomyces albus]|uniref:ATP-binding protein n=1 Tax=Streptomyces albus TaxID=1888 RepID=UPI003D101377
MSQKITETRPDICPSSSTPLLAVLLSSTRRGARLARLMTVAELASRGLPTQTAAHVVAELASNAALHGHVPGRSFRLRLVLPAPGVLRIEVTDALGERAPDTDTGPRQPPVDDESETGRGLVLVEALSERWGVRQGPFPCKTVWADIALAPRAESTAGLRRTSR